MTLGARIRTARKRLKHKPTQGVLAEALGVSTQAVSQWEIGKDRPDPERMPALRKELRVTYKWLFEGNGAPPAPDSLEVRLDDLSEDEERAVGAFLDSYRSRSGNAA